MNADELTNEYIAARLSLLEGLLTRLRLGREAS